MPARSAAWLYGKPEADINNNGEVTLEELRRYLSAAVPSSSVQLLSAQANTLTLPVSTGASLSRALSGFSYGDSLLEDDDPTLEFSYTVTEETAVQYRVVRQVGAAGTGRAQPLSLMKATTATVCSSQDARRAN
ncbi:MAG: hypothetical protein ACLTV6_14220 [Christensenellales bacterium]